MHISIGKANTRSAAPQRIKGEGNSAMALIAFPPKRILSGERSSVTARDPTEIWIRVIFGRTSEKVSNWLAKLIEHSVNQSNSADGWTYFCLPKPLVHMTFSLMTNGWILIGKVWTIIAFLHEYLELSAVYVDEERAEPCSIKLVLQENCTAVLRENRNSIL